MAKINPKEIPETAWQPVTPHRGIAMRVGEGDTVNLRFGQAQGMYLSLSPTQGALIVNTLDYESGDLTIVGKIPQGGKAVVGRTAECQVKVMHAIVSRQHAEFWFEGNVLLVKDLGSTNGTYSHSDNVQFDVQEYLKNHPVESAGEGTLDHIHELFGPTLDDFLKRYSLENKLK